jgi:hypothetical protein
MEDEKCISFNVICFLYTKEELSERSRELDLLLSLEVVEEYRALLGLFTPITDNHTRAVHNFSSVSITINLA